MTPEFTEELFAELKKGDEKAFRTLHKMYGSEIFTYLCRQFPKDRQKAEDLFQDVFLVAYTRIQGVSDAAKVRAWLYRVASNKCIDLRRRRKSRHVSTENFKESRQIKSEGGVDKEVLKRHISRHLDSAIESLPAEHREVFLLREMQSLQYDEIAEALGLSLSKVKKLMGQSVLRLQNELMRYDISHKMLA